MAAPTFSSGSTDLIGRRGECIVEMVAASGGGGGGQPPPTEGQIWPRGF